MDRLFFIACAGLAAVLLSFPVHAQELPVPERVFYPDWETGAQRFRWLGENNVYAIRILGTEAVRAGVEVGFVSQDREFGTVVPLPIVE